MPFSTILLFLAAVLVGGYVQTVAGFGLGMVTISVTVAAGGFDLRVVAAVLSLLSFVNLTMSLRGHVHRVHRHVLVWIVAGQVPGTVAGVWLLEVLSARAYVLLELLVGLFIVAGAASMLVTARRRAAVSRSPACWTAGFSGGIIGGLFSSSAPVIGWFGYTQPLPVLEIRATMLACFIAASATRIVTVGAIGGLVRPVWVLFALSLPVVIGVTAIGRRHAIRFPPAVVRRSVMVFLLLVGSSILVRAALHGVR
jgi:uncharacterized membrane protein YfcA